MQDNTAVLSLNGLGFNYSHTNLLHDVGFSLGRGEMAALTGANGSGKSTLLRIILGELAPNTGTAALFGTAAARFRDWHRIGYVPQNSATRLSGFPATALEIVMTGLYAGDRKRRFYGAAQKKSAMDALELTGMATFSQRMFSQLSGGQVQRVMLARALVSDCELLLLDEPTTGVDQASADMLFAVLAQRVAAGLCVLMITHDSARLLESFTRVFCLEDGSLLELDREQIAHELSHRHTHPVVKKENGNA